MNTFITPFEYQQWVGEPDLLIKVDKNSKLAVFHIFQLTLKEQKNQNKNLTQILTPAFLEKIQGVLLIAF